MTCEEIRPRLALAVGGDLEPAGAAAVQAHLDICPACRAHLRSLEAARTWLKAAADPGFGPEDLAGLRRTVMAEVRRPRRPSIIPLLGALLAAAAALAVVLLRPQHPAPATITVAATPKPPPPEPPPRPAPARVARRPRPEPAPAPPAVDRIEFQTGTPGIRIIWLAARNTPTSNDPTQETP